MGLALWHANMGKGKACVVFFILGLFVLGHCFKDGDFEDNEFAEFEEDGNAPIDVEETASDG